MGPGLPNCVLLVDDSAIIRRSLRRVFEQAGWEVCGEAENGHEAIEKAKHLNPQVIVLDLSMPLMNGLTAGRILKQMLPAVSLILFTLHGNLLPVNDLRLAGISAVVSKVDSAGILLKTAENLVKRSAA
jgi:two-component system chemotaxis response regulator CheY